jgi:hypothetical protein
MNFAEEISIVQDSLTYVLSYAPDFPEEDRTSLTKEARRIIGRFDAVATLARGGTRQEWLRLARQEIASGFEVYAADTARARRHLEDVQEFIRRAIRGAAPQPAFIVGSDSVAHHAPRT